MSPAGTVDYNLHVTKLILVKRVLLVTAALIMALSLPVSSNWKHFNSLIYKSEQAIDAGKLLEASLSLAQAAKYTHDGDRLLEKAGLLAMKSGDRRSAKSYLEQAEDAGGLSASGLVAMGDIALEEGDQQLAVRRWEAALQETQEAEIYSKLAVVYRELGDWEKAIDTQRGLVSLQPNNSQENYQLGLMLAATDPEASLAYLTLAAELDPSIKSEVNSFVRDLRSSLNSVEKAYPFMTAGQTLSAMNEWELASLAFSNAAEINPEYGDAWAYLGEARQHTGGGGNEELAKALEINPDSIASNTLMAIYWQRQERYELALVYLYAAATLDEDNPALQAEIGNTLALMGNLSSAESHYQQAAEMEANKPTYWRNLANFYIRYEIDLREKAATAAREAVILDPEDPAALDLLAQVYLLLDNPFLARRFLERALASDPNYAPAHLHFGLVYIDEGNPLPAFQHLSIAEELSPPGSITAQQARRLLDTHFP